MNQINRNILVIFGKIKSDLSPAMVLNAVLKFIDYAIIGFMLS